MERTGAVRTEDLLDGRSRIPLDDIGQAVEILEGAAPQVDGWLDAPRAWIAEPTGNYRLL